jgi:hypothetical protein
MIVGAIVVPIVNGIEFVHNKFAHSWMMPLADAPLGTTAEIVVSAQFTI